MSIKFAILGILSWKPATGYELKKMFENSAFLYWSGNNNQIYKALIELQNEALVTCEVVHQESSPSKKVYTITAEGLAELREWMLSSTEAPELKKPFLVQLAWADLLSHEELDELLNRYEHELEAQLLMHRENERRAPHAPNRSVRERVIWEMIAENIASTCSNELQWVRTTRRRLEEWKRTEESERMNYQIREKQDGKYIEVTAAANRLSSEDDALDLVALCGEHRIFLVMLHGEVLAESFYNLKTRAAGLMIQKLVNYGIKAVALVPQENIRTGRFGELANELNRGHHFRMYDNRDEAEAWLLGASARG